MSFTPARPIGCRAAGGTQNTFEIVGVCRDEMKSLHEGNLDPDLTASQSAVLFARLRVLVQAARDGVLSFQGGNPQGKVIGRHDCIYEIRARPTRGRLLSRELRLYCGEPQLAETLVLGLHLATKPGRAPDSNGEQDRAIDLAQTRAESWELAHLRAKGRVA